MKMQAEFEKWYTDKFGHYAPDLVVEYDDTYKQLHTHQSYETWLEFNEWHPFEDAPNDGTPVIVIVPPFADSTDKKDEYHIATVTPNVTFIGGRFGFDYNTPTKFRYIP